MKEHRVYDAGEELAVEDELFRALLLLRNVDEYRAFFQDLCTPAELQALKDRWMVAEQLADGLSYRQIRERTGVSLTTIGRVARCLAEPPAGYAAVLQRMGKLES